MKQLDSITYYETINSDKLTLVKFKAIWCRPCSMLSPTFEKLVETYGENINFGEVDIDTHPELAIKDGVRGVPTVIFYKNGQVIDRLSGLHPIQSYIQKLESFK